MSTEKQKTESEISDNARSVPESDLKIKSFNSEKKIFSLLDIITFISLSFVVFGILTLGFLVAPVIFKYLNPRSVASEIMSDIFLRYYPYAFTSILITVGAELLRLLLRPDKILKSKIWAFNFLIILTVAVMTAYSNFVLLPGINDLRLNIKGPKIWNNSEFVLYHKRSEDLAMAIFVLGLIPLCVMVTRR